ncbi:SIMPL domain-containing protein (plasmid) [Entomospira entomophila]|uniref:SIMPL domain-containing protein n=1 Tax=Entomospira entomophila TaxID=2719988 RepID=A0A968KUF4_9SPIO|nr:SIMPL domain-containing protein [Entomospira entomophilus]NIZ41416.1 SIMPL domain-containing protein [Entomospira entomophilus]WDI36366.1 SIMPL domain-containing protein [Entomospira entomophilus]
MMRLMPWRRLILAMLAMIFVVSCQKGPRPVGQIAVSGEAELEVDADEILFTIYIREFYEEERTEFREGRQLRTLGPNIMILERQLFEQLKDKFKIPEEDIVLENGSTTTIHWGSVRSERPLASRTYTVTVRSVDLSNAILNMTLPSQASVRLRELRYSKIDEFKLEVKRLALDNAKVRADNLASGFGKVIGLIFVSEEESRITQQQGDTGMVLMNASGLNEMRMKSDMMLMDSREEVSSSPVQWRKIRVSASVDAVFAVQ